MHQHALRLLQVLSGLTLAVSSHLEAHTTHVTNSQQQHMEAVEKLRRRLEQMQSLRVGEGRTVYDYINLEGVTAVLDAASRHISDCTQWLNELSAASAAKDTALREFREGIVALLERCKDSENGKVLCGFALDVGISTDVARRGSVVVTLQEPRSCSSDYSAVKGLCESCLHVTNGLAVAVNNLRACVRSFRTDCPPGLVTEIKALTQWYENTAESHEAWEREVQRRTELTATVRALLEKTQKQLRAIQQEESVQREKFCAQHRAYLPQEMIEELSRIDHELLRVTRVVRYV